MVLGAVAAVALALLAVRSYAGLELRWDAWWYHVPFAAKAVHMDIDYQLPNRIHSLYEGHPFLPHFLMGVLWRATGSLNAVGVINIVGFGGFLAVCHRLLRAPIYVVAPVALTAPLVIIHSATSYIDLFANSLLAIGLCTLAYVYLYAKTQSTTLMWTSAAGFVGALWSKPQLGLIASCGLALWYLLYRPPLWRAAALAAVGLGNHIKNFALYGNPFWPVEVPVFGKAFPATYHYADPVLREQRPPALRDTSGVEMFVRSLFELNNPTSYPNRARWTIDQGNTAEALRMGGFWDLNVVAYLVLAVALLLVLRQRRGRVVALTALGLMVVLSLQPNSHDLRYYLFLPLCWAGVVGMLYRELKYRHVWAGLALLIVVGTLFGAMARENRAYYQVRERGYRAAARAWNVDTMWRYLRPGYTYCVINAAPTGFFYTGPTHSEFRIVDREREAECPTGAVPIIERVVHYERRT